MNKTETRQNYLEAIYIISKQKGNVRSIDVAEYLSFSRPTVSIALKQLKDEGYLDVVDNLIKLSSIGIAEAEKMYERHEMIAQILIDLGVKENIAYNDSCLIEHDLSDESFAAIKNYYLSIKEKK